MCTDVANNAMFDANYDTSVKEVICDAISHICHCDLPPTSELPYDGMVDFVYNLMPLDNDMLLRFLGASYSAKCLSLLEPRREHITVNQEILRGVANNEMKKAGITEIVLKCNETESALADCQPTWSPLC